MTYIVIKDEEGYNPKVSNFVPGLAHITMCSAKKLLTLFLDVPGLFQSDCIVT